MLGAEGALSRGRRRCGMKMRPPPFSFFIKPLAAEGSKGAEEPNFTIIVKFKLQCPTCRMTTKF